nr:hypothetical protein [Candidatus Microthrix sp.]
MAPEAFGRFLTTIFDEWSRTDIGEMYVQHFDAALANWYGEPAASVSSPRRASAVALDTTATYSMRPFVETGLPLG